MKTTEETINEINELFTKNSSFKGGSKFAVLKPIEPYDDVDWDLVEKTLSPVKIDFHKEIQTIYVEKL